MRIKLKASLFLFLGLLLGGFVKEVHAQTIPAGFKAAIIKVSSLNESVAYGTSIINLDIASNVDYVVSSNADWIHVQKNGTSTYLKCDANLYPTERVGKVVVSDPSKQAQSRTITVTQAPDGSAEYVKGDDQVAVSSARADREQPGSGIEKSIDGDFTTIYHSPWSGDVSPENPAVLEYFFKDVDVIDYLVYHPRQSGSNGNFGELEIWYKTTENTTYTKAGDYDFKKSGTATRVEFDEALRNPTAIKFVVKTGGGDAVDKQYATCAEMQFFTFREKDPSFDVFADELCTTLKEGVTLSTIQKLKNPFARSLAQKIFENNYPLNYRVSTHECLLSPQALSEQWAAPGKLYDQVQGVTGIMLTPGKTVVMAEGIPKGKSVSLRVIGWTVPEGATFYSETYPLSNGINVIEKTSDWNGLAYIDYYDYNPEQYAQNPVKIHVVNGIVNGVLTPDKSNKEMDELLKAAPYTTIDLFGERVHSVWETKALQQYTRNYYRQYMNVLDTLVAWEHRLLGLEKYNRIPKNKTMAYVNYNYYMYQGGFGVTFKYDTQNRCCSPSNIMKKDDDVVWGLSHEWGHQHQMNPYFCWAGLSESSNNMNSCYNVLHMGYAGSRVKNGWEKARKNILKDEVVDNAGAGRRSGGRARAYWENNRWSWNKELQDLAKTMIDSIVPKQSDDLDKSISINEVYVETNLAPFFMLHCYFTPTLPDYSPDTYEALRQTDADTDKYAVLAAAQNGKQGKYDEFKAAYPTSAWITHNYLYAGSTTWDNSVPYIFNYVRKASKVCGYNLYPYFEKWGFFRLIANVIDDYGVKLYAMTAEMKNEFKADMDKLVTEGYVNEKGETVKLKVMADDMIDEISNAPIPQFSTPNIPN